MKKSRTRGKKRQNLTKKCRIKSASNSKRGYRGGVWPFDLQTAPPNVAQTNVSSIKELSATAKKNGVVANSSSATNLSLYQLAKEKEMRAVASAAAISGLSLAGYGIITGLSMTGVGLPLAGALAGVLLLSNKMASLYINNQKMKSVMYDVMNIISNCYRLNDIINKSTGIFTIYIYNQYGYKTMAPPFNDDNLYKSLLEKALVEKGKSLGLPNQTGGNVGYKDEFKTNLVGKISMNEDVKDRIREKIQDITQLLLKNATDRILGILQRDDDVTKSGFGVAVTQEYNRRNASFSKTLGKIKRGFDRTVNSKTIQDDILKDLTIINGFFTILKSQYDMTLELYERELGEDWNRVWSIIQSTDEYVNYMVPKDVRLAAAEIVKSEDTMKIAANIIEKKIETDIATSEAEQKNGADTVTETPL